MSCGTFRNLITKHFVDRLRIKKGYFPHQVEIRAGGGETIMDVRIGIAALILFVCTTQGLRSHEAAPRQATDVDKVVDAAVEAFRKTAPQVPGLSIGVLKNGKAYTYNFG